MLGELTIEAAKTIDPAYADQMNLAMNYYFIIASTFFLAIVGTLVSQFIVEPRLGTYEGAGAGAAAAARNGGRSDSVHEGTPDPSHDATHDEGHDPAQPREGDVGNPGQEAHAAPVATAADDTGTDEAGSDDEDLDELTPVEKKGIRWAMLSLLVTVGLLALTIVPTNGPLRGEGGAVVQSPFMDALVVVIIIAFFVPGLVYGIVTGSIKNDNDVADKLSDTMASMALFILLAFTAGQFVAYFSESNLGTFMAVYGADLLDGINLTGILLIILFILIVGVINMFIGSASAKWAVLAPVFVPIMMQLGYSPELTQMAYRIADSSTNIITPLMTYFALIIAFAQKYDRSMRIGSLISVMLPYSIAFLVSWTIMMVVWMMVGLPLGPNAPIHYP